MAVSPVKMIDDHVDDDDDDDCASTNTAGSSSGSSSSRFAAVSSSVAVVVDDETDQQQSHEEEVVELLQLLKIIRRLQQLLVPSSNVLVNTSCNRQKKETSTRDSADHDELFPPNTTGTTTTTTTTTTKTRRGERTKTIVITGANSGIGLAAAKLLWLMANDNYGKNQEQDEPREECCCYRLVLVCRTQAKADWAAKQVRRVVNTTLVPSQPHHQTSSVAAQQQQQQNVIIPLACDQTSLDDVHRFNERIRVALAPNPAIDVLCLNAAVLSGHDDPPSFTRDGLEQTFQVNYLSTVLLSHLLLDMMTTATARPPGRIIFTTSGLYETTPLTNISGIRHQLSSLYQHQQEVPPQHHQQEQQRQLDRARHYPSQQPRRLAQSSFFSSSSSDWAMPDCSPYHYKRAYALSKTLLVRHCAELQRRCRRRPHRANYHNEDEDDGHHQHHRNDVIVNCFSPGLMLDTGLFRHQSRGGVMAKLLQHNPHAMANAKSVYWGAGALVYMALFAAASGHNTATITKATEVLENSTSNGDVDDVDDDDTCDDGGQYWSDRDSQLGDDAIYGHHFRAVSIMTTDQCSSSSRNNSSCTGITTSTTIDDVAPETVTDDELWRVSMELIRLRCRASFPPLWPLSSSPRQPKQHEPVLFTNGSYAATIG